MFDAECELAALVYDEHQDPDAVLLDSAVLLHPGEKLLLARDFDPAASGCRLDAERLQSAGARIANALEAGADLLIVNRFGKRERDGKGLGYVIERALEADTQWSSRFRTTVLATGSVSRVA